MKITPLRIGIGLAGAGSFLIIAYSLVAAPGSQSPFKLLDRFFPPAIAKAKVDTIRDDKIKAEAKAAKAKADAESKAKAEKAKARFWFFGGIGLRIGFCLCKFLCVTHSVWKYKIYLGWAMYVVLWCVF